MKNKEKAVSFIKEKEVHEMTGIALSKLRLDRSNSTGFPYYKIGKMVRYKKQDVIDYIEKHKVFTNQSSSKIKRRKR